MLTILSRLLMQVACGVIFFETDFPGSIAYRVGLAGIRIPFAVDVNLVSTGFQRQRLIPVDGESGIGQGGKNRIRNFGYEDAGAEILRVNSDDSRFQLFLDEMEDARVILVLIVCNDEQGRPAVIDPFTPGEGPHGPVPGDDVIVNMVVHHHQHQVIHNLVVERGLQCSLNRAHQFRHVLHFICADVGKFSGMAIQ